MVTRRSSGPTGYYDRSDAYENLRSGVLIYYPGDLDIAPRRGGERFDVRRRKTTESQAGPKIFLKSPIPTAWQIKVYCRGAGRERAKRPARGNHYFFARFILAARRLKEIEGGES